MFEIKERTLCNEVSSQQWEISLTQLLLIQLLSAGLQDYQQKNILTNWQNLFTENFENGVIPRVGK